MSSPLPIGTFLRSDDYLAIDAAPATSTYEESRMSGIEEQMEVVGDNGIHVGVVGKIEGDRIKLTKNDSGEGSHKGHHHYIDRSLQAGVERDQVRLSATGVVAVTLEEK